MLYVIGAGGHGKVVIDALHCAGQSPNMIRVRDGNPTRAGQSLMGYPIETPELVANLRGDLFHIAIGHCGARAQRHRDAIALGGIAQTVVHPAATVAESAQIGPGCFIAAGAVIGPSAVIGVGVIINHGAVVDHDCTVDDYAHIAPNATLGGGVEVGALTLIGSGAVVLPQLHVGNRTIVGAGAVITRRVGDSEVWVGNPAQERKPI